MGLDDVVDIIRRYDVPVDVSALQAVAEDEEQRRLLSEWAKSHLTADTLLSKDELSSYRTIQRNGKAESLAASVELPIVHPFSDQELKNAIDELNRSTEAITKQTESLRLQQDALSRLLTTTDKTGDSRSEMEARRLYQWEADRKATNTAVELTSQSLDYRVTELEQQAKGTDAEVTKTVDEMLQSDDRLLSSLQKLAWELDTEDPEETDSVAELREICARLIKFTVECIRVKLDRLYLENLESFQQSGSSKQAPKEEITELQDELESLYAEILPVAQMSVEQQFLEPSLRSLSCRNGNSLARSYEALAYILDCFDYLLDKMDRISGRILLYKSHETATAALVATAKTELSTTVASATRRGTVTSLSSPARQPRSLNADSMMTPAPFRGATSTTKSQVYASGGVAYDSPLEHLLGELALNMAESDDLGAQAQAASLSSTLAERTCKAADMARNVQLSFETTATSHLADARAALQLMRESVLAESPYAEVHLVDPGIEASIGVLGQEVHNMTSRLEGFERDAAALARGRNVKREEMIARWGGRV